MAHSGKTYPVHFRRDLNINSTTNNTGWPRAFGLTSDNAFGTVGSNLLGHRWVCIARDEPTYPGLLYESEYITISGRDIMFRLVGDQTTFNTNPALLGEINDRVKGNLGHFGQGYAPTGHYQQGSGSYRFFEDPFPDLFRVVFNTNVVTGAVLWEEWNNL